MQGKEKLIDSLYDRQFLNDDEEIILSDGFEKALIGVSASEPKVAIYDYWKALDCVIKKDPEIDFNDALDWLDKFVKMKVSDAKELTPIFVKTL
jgi:hypothetical protein